MTSKNPSLPAEKSAGDRASDAVADTDPSTARYLESVKEMGCFLDVRQLPDGSIAALGDLLFTRAIHTGCTEWGWSKRYCFKDRDLADREFAQLQSEDDEPQGWIATRPVRPR